jgi:transcriptional regulator with XRE-family HTH domain
VAREPSVASICAGVARLLKEERLAQQLSLTRVADEASLSRQMVSYVERGLRIPTLDTLLRITRALDIDLSKLITRARRRL